MSAPSVFILGGCGHVGLPLGISLANVGATVRLYDIDAERTATVRAGRMPFIEYGADALLTETLGSTLFVENDLAELAASDYVVVTIGTPVDEYLNPRYGPLFDLLDTIAGELHEGQTLVLRSTLFPGTTREFARRLQAQSPGVLLSYCPERIAQGYAIEELDRLPQIVSGTSPEAVDSSVALFRQLTDRILEVEVEEAELAKLFLNSWRYIQFAIANQFFMIAEEQGVDFFRIHRAMTEGYDRATDFPMSGFTAGPCLLKDTMQLAALNRSGFQLGHAAMLVNEGLVNFIVEGLRARYDLSTTTVGILGMAFKADIDDTRDSLAFKLRKLLVFHGARVLMSDEFAADPSFVSPEQLLEESDVVVIGAPHSSYRELVFPVGKDVVDVWGFLAPTRAAARF